MQEPQQKSILEWAIPALGEYALLLPVVGVLSFILIAVLLFRGKGPFAGASLVLVVALPLLVGLFGAITGLLKSFSVIAMSELAPEASQMAMGISTALFSLLVGTFITGGLLVIAILGSFIKALIHSDAPAT